MTHKGAIRSPRILGVEVEETREAVELHNELAASLPVGGLAHSTC